MKICSNTTTPSSAHTITLGTIGMMIAIIIKHIIVLLLFHSLFSLPLHLFYHELPPPFPQSGGHLNLHHQSSNASSLLNSSSSLLNSSSSLSSLNSQHLNSLQNSYHHATNNNANTNNTATGASSTQHSSTHPHHQQLYNQFNTGPSPTHHLTSHHQSR